MSDKKTTMTIRGIPISPGLVAGSIHVQKIMPDHPDTPDAILQSNAEIELERLQKATTKITADLNALAARVKKEIDSKLAAIFDAHQHIVNDSSLKEELRKEIVVNLMSASSAVKTVFLRWEKRFLLMESPIARNKSDDIRDISIRLRNALDGKNDNSQLETIPSGCILATSHLLPSDTVFLVGCNTAAILLESGSIGSHASIFIRELGLPCLTGIDNMYTTVPHGAFALLDADKGTVVIHPDENQTVQFRKKVIHKVLADNRARKRSLGPAITADGTPITVLANVGCAEDTRKAIRNGAEGVGLYRMERTYLGSSMPPGINDLLDDMRRTLEPARGRSVCVRLLDIGGDKPMPFLRFMTEANPALGRRGIRLLHEYPELLTTHLTAVLELSREFDVSVLVPMVTLPDDVAKVKQLLGHLGEQLSLAVLPRLGAMIETPAAIFSVREIAKYVDFMSVGTTDLTQYTFAADRENAAIGHYFNDASEVIFRMLQIAHDDVPEMPFSICGELAGRPQHIPRLLQCGIRTFSVAPPLVPIIKDAIRKSSLAEVMEVALMG